MSEEDKPTEVLDLNALKEQLKQKKKVEELSSDDLEFVTSVDIEQEDQNEGLSLNDELGLEEDSDLFSEKKFVFFDFKCDYFEKHAAQWASDREYEVVSDLKALNNLMKTKDEIIVFFNYTKTPKEAAQLIKQIKTKYTWVETVIVAKGLSEKKAQAHKKSPSGAHFYVNPQSEDPLSEIKKAG